MKCIDTFMIHNKIWKNIYKYYVMYFYAGEDNALFSQ